jgi:hypothetical protein
VNRSILSIVVLAAVVFAAVQAPAALAQGKQMYRCGSNYQDRPCDGAAPAAAKAASAQGATGKAAIPAADAAKAGTSATAAGTTTANASPPVLTKAQQQRQIRCENFGRQLDELKERQKAAPNQAEAMGVQIRSLQSRMGADGC